MPKISVFFSLLPCLLDLQKYTDFTGELPQSPESALLYWEGGNLSQSMSFECNFQTFAGVIRLLQSPPMWSDTAKWHLRAL